MSWVHTIPANFFRRCTPVNYVQLQTPGVGKDRVSVSIDIADLSDEQLDDLAKFIAVEFVEHAKGRRLKRTELAPEEKR